MESATSEHRLRQAAHDLRSPLGALKTLSNEDVTAGLSEADRSLLRIATQRIAAIVADLAADLKGGLPIKAPQDKAPTYAGLVEEVIQEKKAQLRAAGSSININFAICGTEQNLDPKVKPSSFQRVISNLLQNSIEAISQKGEIVVVLDHFAPNHWELTISDNGIGIPPQILPLLMTRGFSYKKSGGSGLGLCHAKESAQSWGAELSIRSQLGAGTQISICF